MAAAAVGVLQGQCTPEVTLDVCIESIKHRLQVPGAAPLVAECAAQCARVLSRLVSVLCCGVSAALRSGNRRPFISLLCEWSPGFIAQFQWSEGTVFH